MANLLRRFLAPSVQLPSFLSFHTSAVQRKVKDRRDLIASAPKKGEGTDGESSVNVDTLLLSRSNIIPLENTPNMLFNGVAFSKIPICNISVSKNNTILTMCESSTGEVHMTRSCGVEGFKNTRKGTNVAAQATAITFATNALKKGYKTIRVRVRGLGPGRMSAIKGLEMAGLDIISVTDNTPVSWHPSRPRKRRKL